MISAIGLLVFVYGVIHIFAALLKTTTPFFLFPYAHYIYPVVYSIALVCYLGISEIFTLSPPTNYGSGNDVSVQLGVFFMFVAEVTGVVSLLFYLFTSKKRKAYTRVLEEPAPESSEPIRK